MINSSVPKIIHQIWMQGYDKIPKKFHANVEKNKMLNPDFTYMFWDETKILKLLKDPMLLDTYDNFDYMLQKVDFARYLILYYYGGITIDMDAYCIKPLSDMLNNMTEPYDIAISKSNLNFLESYVLCYRGEYYSNANIIAKTRCHFLKAMINQIVIDSKTLSKPYTQISAITNSTGPAFFTNFIYDYNDNVISPNKSIILLLDYHIVEPCKAGICDINDDTYIVHKHELSWINTPVKYIMNVYLVYSIEIMILVIIILIMLIILTIIWVKNSLPHNNML